MLRLTNQTPRSRASRAFDAAAELAGGKLARLAEADAGLGRGGLCGRSCRGKRRASAREGGGRCRRNMRGRILCRLKEIRVRRALKNRLSANFRSGAKRVRRRVLASRREAVSHLLDLPMHFLTPRNLSGLGIVIGLIAACSPTGPNTSTNLDPSGNSGRNEERSSGTGGSVNPGSGGGGNSISTSGSSGSSGVMTGTGVVPEDDPANPYITHPKCGVGACTDFPDAPLNGDGVPANAAALFGDPDNFSAGSFCVLEPQLSSSSTPGRDDPGETGYGRASSSTRAGSTCSRSASRTPRRRTISSRTRRARPGTCRRRSGPATGMPANADDMITIAGNGRRQQRRGRSVHGDDSAASTPRHRASRRGVRGDFNVAPVVATGSMVFWTVNSPRW